MQFLFDNSYPHGKWILEEKTKRAYILKYQDILNAITDKNNNTHHTSTFPLVNRNNNTIWDLFQAINRTSNCDANRPILIIQYSLCFQYIPLGMLQECVSAICTLTCSSSLQLYDKAQLESKLTIHVD